jgi:ABC-2 type transport system permease protein
MFILTKRIIKQLINDKRSLALIFFVPIMLFTFIYLLLGSTDYKAKITENNIPQQIIQKMKDNDVDIQSVTNAFGIAYANAEGMEKVKNGTSDAFFYKDGSELRILMQTNDVVKSGVVMKAIQNAIKAVNPSSILKTEFLYGKSDDSMFNSIGYVLLGILSFFLVFIIAGISFVREKTGNTIERLMLTPIKRWEVVLGYTLGFGFFTVLQCIVMLTFAIYGLGMPIAGSFLDAVVIMLMLSLAAVSIGSFVSIFSNNEFQIVQFIPALVVPQIFFSGLISLDTLPYHLGLLAKIFPVFYACDGLKMILIKGQGIASIWPDIMALFIFITLFSALNIQALKKYRRI